MKTFTLCIETFKDQTFHEGISSILKVPHTPVIPFNEDEFESYHFWNYELTEKYGEEPVDFINIFLDLLEPNFEELFKLGIHKSAIKLTVHQEFGEFEDEGYYIDGKFKLSSDNMKRLGENGLDLRIEYNDVIHYSI